MIDNLLVEVIGEFSYEADSHGLDFGGLQRRERPQDLVRAVIVLLEWVVCSTVDS